MMCNVMMIKVIIKMIPIIHVYLFFLFFSSFDLFFLFFCTLFFFHSISFLFLFFLSLFIFFFLLYFFFFCMYIYISSFPYPTNLDNASAGLLSPFRCLVTKSYSMVAADHLDTLGLGDGLFKMYVKAE